MTSVLAAILAPLWAPLLAMVLALSPLGQRAATWPDWHLPAPLNRPGQGDLTYPDWFEGNWQLTSEDLGPEPIRVRFVRNQAGAVVGDRAANGLALGRAVMGDKLLEVANDPANPNRQIAIFQPEPGLRTSLESTVIGRRQAQASANAFEADELALQVLHGPGEPRVSQVETLSRYELQADGQISGEQWQASYPSPEAGLIATAIRSNHLALKLRQLAPLPPPESDHAS